MTNVEKLARRATWRLETGDRQTMSSDFRSTSWGQERDERGGDTTANERRRGRERGAAACARMLRECH